MNQWGKSRGKDQNGEHDIVDISDEAFWEERMRTPERKDSVQVEEFSQMEDSGQEEKSGLSAFPDDGELTITSVQMLKRPKHRYRIFFGTYVFEVHEDVMIKYRMIKGAVFTKAELEEIISADERQRSYADALSYLSRKPRTAYEISMRLKEKGWGEETVNDVIHRLHTEGYLNDAAYAQEWASQRVKLRGKGKLWVRHELRQKGVSKPLIEEALGEVSEDDEFASAMLLGAKKWRGTSGEPLDKKRKTGAFLQRRGFSGKIVSKVLRELSREDGMNAEDEWYEE